VAERPLDGARNVTNVLYRRIADQHRSRGRAPTRAGARFSVTARLTPTVTTAIAGIDEQAWTPIRYPNAIVIDRVRARDHPGDQGEDLRRGVRPARGGDGEALGQQRRETAPSGERHDRHQPSTRHEVRIVEPPADHGAGVR